MSRFTVNEDSLGVHFKIRHETDQEVYPVNHFVGDHVISHEWDTVPKSIHFAESIGNLPNMGDTGLIITIQEAN